MEPHASTETARPQFFQEPFPHWRAQHQGIEVRFLGRGAPSSPVDALATLELEPPQVAWLRQTHSARVRSARPGACGEGDALRTKLENLALCVVTADCVPIICSSSTTVVGIHAGWRGLAGGVIGAALTGPPGAKIAWIGPSIGPCCYEVGEEVAEQVVTASDAAVLKPGTSGRPHLDLGLAAELQLRGLGVQTVHRVHECTRCQPRLLWSYRRQGEARGRNLTFGWQTERDVSALS